MADDIMDAVKLLIETVEAVHHELTVGDRRVNIGQQIGEGLEFAAVFLDGEISDCDGAKVVFQLQCSVLFVVTEEPFKGKPEFSSRAFGFEDCLGE